MMKRLLFAALPALLLVLPGCDKNEALEAIPNSPQEILDDVRVPISRVPLFAELSDYNLLPNGVRTRADEETVPLESLLNRKEASEMTFKGVLYRQTPFLQNDDEILASVTDNDEMDASLAVKVKKYLVETIYPDADKPIVQIATLVAMAQYAETHPDFTFLSRPNFSGAILYSDVDGTLVGARHYWDGQIADGDLLTAEEIDREEGEVIYLTSFLKGIATRDGSDGGELPFSICIGYRFNWITGSFCSAIRSGGGSGGGEGGSKNNSQYGNGLNAPDQQRNMDDGDKVEPQEPECSLALTSNCPDEVMICFKKDEVNVNNMSININGRGVFNVNTRIAVWHQYTNSTSQLDFSFWAGAFDGMETDDFSFVIREDMVSTAYYGVPKPCVDKQKGVANPLMNMLVAATNEWNYKGGLYGKNRWEFNDNGELEQTKNHHGVDFYATPGTPVFAMRSGTVVRVVSDFGNDPVDDSRGNEIWIESTLSAGKKIVIRYCHLQAGNAIGYNYRTGSTFALNETVYQGEIIGYAGRTGNATNVPNPHLHLEVRVNGVEQDPANYINGTINAATINSLKGQVNNIKCD